MSDDKLVGSALAAGVREASVRHLHAGLPVVVWRDGKTVWLGPEEIKQCIKEIDDNSN